MMALSMRLSCVALAAAAAAVLWHRRSRRGGAVRAALDIGSGEHKLVVAEMRGGAVARVLHSEVAFVPLALDLKRTGGDGTLSAAVLAQSDEALARFATTARHLGATAPAGIATAVFRRASNGGPHLVAMNLKHEMVIDVVNQDLEGRLGYLTAKALAGDQSGDIVAWDSGGGSFQITAASASGNVLVYEGPIGTADVHAMLRDAGGAVDDSSVSAAITAVAAAVPPAPDWLKKQLAAGTVVAFGARSSIFRLAADILGEAELTPIAVEEALRQLLSHRGTEQAWLDERAASAKLGSADWLRLPFPEVALALPKLCLLLGVMRRLDIRSIEYHETNGSCLGLLLLAEGATH